VKPKKTTPTADYDAFIKAIVSLESEKEAKAFLEDLCTPAERESMVDRWRVIKPLLAGESYRQVYETTGVSVTTVGRVARVLREGTGAYLNVYQKLGGTVPKGWG
jgi:TrpR-related protein YerC/YecD